MLGERERERETAENRECAERNILKLAKDGRRKFLGEMIYAAYLFIAPR